MGKRALGKGLSALISETSGGDQEGRVREVPVTQVTPNPYQPRTLFDPIKMEELVSSIKEHGILQPILLREIGHERFQIVAGERRFRAAQSAGLNLVPAIIKECSERNLLEMAVVENVQRDDIGAIEAARAYRRMIDEFGMTQETVSLRVGKSRSSVANVLRLLDLPEFVQDSLERSEISEGHGKALLKLRDDTDALERAWRRTVQGQLSVRATEKVVEDLLSSAQFSARTSLSSPFTDKTNTSSPVLSSTSLLPDPHEASMVEALQQRFGTKVYVRRGARRGGRIEIEFYNDEELERLSELLLSKGDR
jgi:ParB family chromosome partitioning protein